jgi:hypothetical protein
VLLAPPFEEEKDLSGSIIAEGETLPATTTNQTARSAMRGKSAKDLSGSGRSKTAADKYGRGRGAPGNKNQAAEQATGASTSTSSLPPADPAAVRKQFYQDSSGSRSNQQSLLKQYDLNRDGQLDASERAAMREQLTRDARSGSTLGK